MLDGAAINTALVLPPFHIALNLSKNILDALLLGFRPLSQNRYSMAVGHMAPNGGEPVVARNAGAARENSAFLGSFQGYAEELTYWRFPRDRRNG